MGLRALRKSVGQALAELKELYAAEGIWERFVDRTRQQIKETMEVLLREQVTDYLAACVQEGICDRRNGSYSRQLTTQFGEIELCIPRTRTFSPVACLKAYARRTKEVDRLILAGFLFGLSTRKLTKEVLPILGIQVSPATVSRVAKQLDQVVAAFHRRPLPDHYQTLIFDGVLLRRRTGAGALSRPVLVALGLTADQRKEIIDFQLAPAESQAAWEGLLNDLYRRGLKGQGLELITVDGGKGLLAALPLVYPQIPVQRCWTHKTRNLVGMVRRADQEQVGNQLCQIYEADTRLEAQQATRCFVKRWQAAYPRMVASLKGDLEELLAHYCFADPAWRKATRTTNAIERRFREVRRRTRPMGTFSDRTSIERILFAVFSHENKNQGTATPFPLTQTI
jgi:putative transposase